MQRTENVATGDLAHVLGAMEQAVEKACAALLSLSAQSPECASFFIGDHCDEGGVDADEYEKAIFGASVCSSDSTGKGSVSQLGVIDEAGVCRQSEVSLGAALIGFDVEHGQHTDASKTGDLGQSDEGSTNVGTDIDDGSSGDDVVSDMCSLPGEDAVDAESGMTLQKARKVVDVLGAVDVVPEHPSHAMALRAIARLVQLSDSEAECIDAESGLTMQKACKSLDALHAAGVGTAHPSHSMALAAVGRMELRLRAG